MSSTLMLQQPFDGVLQMFNPGYNLVAAIIRNGHAAPVTVTAAAMSLLPVVFSGGKAVLTPAANANTYNALILKADAGVTALAAATDSSVKAIVMVRGPALIDAGKMKAVDAAGASIVAATAKTALSTLPVPPIVPVDPSATSVLAPV